MYSPQSLIQQELLVATVEIPATGLFTVQYRLLVKEFAALLVVKIVEHLEEEQFATLAILLEQEQGIIFL
jgi:hypothetical protein